MDNLDSLLQELEVKEKKQQVQHENSQKEQDEVKRMAIVEQQRLEIERLKAQLANQQDNNNNNNHNNNNNFNNANTTVNSNSSNSVSLDFTDSPRAPKTNFSNQPKNRNNKQKKNNNNNNNNNNNKNNPRQSIPSHKNNNQTNNQSYTTTYQEKNNKVSDTPNKVNNSTTTVLQEDVELEKLKAELALEQSRLQKKQEAEQLRQEIEKLRAINTGSNNNNNNNNNNSNNTNRNVTPQEKALRDDIERMKQELGNSSYSEKTRIEELEKIKESMKQELTSLKSKGPVKPDPQKEKRLAELERQKLDLQRELSTGPSRDELLQLHGQNKKELNDIQFGVDVCFLMDCTGSMKAFIRAAKESIHKVVAQIKEIDPRAVLHFAFVGYRDYSDKIQHEKLDFIDYSQIPIFENMVGAIDATGGGDAPEDVAGGLEICTKLSWVSSTRLLIHIADAPCHGCKYHKFGEKYDDYPNGDPKGLVPEELLKRLLALRVDYYFLRMTRHTDTMVAIFKKVYDAAKKTFEVHPVASDPSNFLPKVVASIHSSMAQSVAFRK